MLCIYVFRNSLSVVLMPGPFLFAVVSEERETLTRGLAGWVQRPEKPVPAAGNTSLTAAQGGVQMPLGKARVKSLCSSLGCGATTCPSAHPMVRAEASDQSV